MKTLLRDIRLAVRTAWLQFSYLRHLRRGGNPDTF